MAAFLHTNLNVLDLDKSLAFYRQALGLREARRVVPEDGSFVIVFLEDGHTGYQLELTWLRDRREPYNLGDNEFHLAFRVEDKAAAHALHESWAASATRTPPWISTSSRIPTATGWKSWIAKKALPLKREGFPSARNG